MFASYLVTYGPGEDITINNRDYETSPSGQFYKVPDARLEDGSRLFDHMRGHHATELIMPEGRRILIRPDGYVAYIGSTHFAEYAGEPTRACGAVPQR